MMDKKLTLTVKGIRDSLKKDQVVDLFRTIETSKIPTKRYSKVVDSDSLWLIIKKLFDSGWGWKRICPALEKAKIRRPKQALSWEPKRAATWFGAVRRKNANKKPSLDMYTLIQNLKLQQKGWAYITMHVNRKGFTNRYRKPWKASTLQKFYARVKDTKEDPWEDSWGDLGEAKISDEVTVVRPTNSRAIILFDGAHLDIKLIEDKFVVEALWVEKGSVSNHTIAS